MGDLDAGFHNLSDNISGVGSSINHKAEPTSSKRTLFSLPDNQTKDFKKANTTTDLMDTSLSYRTSFSLPDNQTNDSKKANTTPDLMDGRERRLGKINTKTPVNSPQP